MALNCTFGTWTICFGTAIIHPFIIFRSKDITPRSLGYFHWHHVQSFQPPRERWPVSCWKSRASCYTHREKNKTLWLMSSVYGIGWRMRFRSIKDIGTDCVKCMPVMLAWNGNSLTYFLNESYCEWFICACVLCLKKNWAHNF